MFRPRSHSSEKIKQPESKPDRKSNLHRVGSLARKPNNGENYVIDVVVILMAKYTSEGAPEGEGHVLGERGAGRHCHHVPPRGM